MKMQKTGMSRKSSLRSLLAMGAILVAAQFAHAQTWNGGGGNVNWSTAGNWTGGAPTSSTNTNIIFAGSTNLGTSGTPLIQNITATMAINSITFSNTAGAFFIGGTNGFNIDNGATITQSSANAQSIANGFTESTLNSTQTLTLAGDGAGVVTLSGALTGDGSQNNQAIAVSKTGLSTYVLSNTANTYSGGTTISAGVLRIAAAASLGSGTALVSTGGVLGLNGNFDANSKINASSVGIIALNVNNTALTGLNGSSAFLGSSGNFTFTPAGLFSSGASNTYRLGGGGGTLTLVGANKLTGAKALIVGSTQTNGGGTVVLSTDQNYTSGTTVNAGTLRVNNTTNSGTGTAAVTVNSGGTLGGNGFITTTVANTGVTVAAGGKLSPGAATNTTGTLTFTLNGTGKLDISGAVAASNTQSLQFDLNGSAAAATSDKIVLASTTALSIGSGVLSFDDFAFTIGNGVTTGKYVLFDSSSAITGTLGPSLSLSGTINSFVSGNIAFDDTNRDIVLFVTAAPEPSSFAIIGLATIGMLARKRRAVDPARTIAI